MADEDRTPLDDVVRAGVLAGGPAYLELPNALGVDRVRAAVRAAFECAIGNHLIEITDPASWPAYLAIDPPYSVERLMGGSRG